MGHLTYKVFNIYFSIRCGTYNSHLHTTLPSNVSPSIHHAPPSSGSSYLLVSLLLVSPQRTDTAPPLLVSPNGLVASVVPFVKPGSDTDTAPPLLVSPNGPAASVVPFVEPGSDTTVGSWGELGGASTSRLEQPHKQERRHALTQNFNAIGLWVILLIRCSTFTFLSDVGHITHTCTQQ